MEPHGRFCVMLKENEQHIAWVMLIRGGQVRDRGVQDRDQRKKLGKFLLLCLDLGVFFLASGSFPSKQLLLSARSLGASHPTTAPLARAPRFDPNSPGPGQLGVPTRQYFPVMGTPSAKQKNTKFPATAIRKFQGKESLPWLSLALPPDPLSLP